MANYPVPRSYNQILGDAEAAFLSRTGLPSLKVGSPVLSVLEASAQSDLRNSQDIFMFLNAQSLDRAEGQALDRTGADEDVPRQTESLASGLVTVTDPNFLKISTRIYAGTPAPIAGSSAVYVQDAAAFSASGNLYVGRGTVNLEGPLVYTAKTNLGTYWRLDLDPGSKTVKFHNIGEDVTLAQGGNRPIPAGSVVGTLPGNSNEAIQFITLYAAQIPDGETQVAAMTVVAQKPGTVGNVPAGAIKKFATPPFTGAVVTNPLPFTNALANESDQNYRERIRTRRQSKSLGTALAIETNVLGAVTTDENKRIASASVVDSISGTTLYIDDGTGYEEPSVGVPLETVLDAATGGEQSFSVSALRPVTKAFVVTTLSAPFNLSAGMVLAVNVGGVLQKHTFNASEFRTVSNADAFEVVSSINADPAVTFSARTLGSGTLVALMADANVNENLEVVAADSDEIDANTALGFPVGRVDTMWLYKNDRLLSKDGSAALLESEPQANWASMTSGMTLTLAIDGTPAVTYSFVDLDFVNAATGYATVSASNSLTSWATVMNAKIPGITVTVTGGRLTMVSNLGRSSRSRLAITGGTLATAGKMFSFSTAAGLIAVGMDFDYSLDRNTGEIYLQTPVAALDRLTLGSTNTRAFIESPTISTVTLASTAEFWICVDGGATLVSTQLTTSSSVDVTTYVPAPPVTWGNRVKIVATAGAPFVNILTGDWAIFLDTNFSVANRGAWRIAYVDPGATFFEIEKVTSTPEAGISLSGGGIVFARTRVPVQKISISAAANYTAATLVDGFNAGLVGATASVYRTNRVRIRTNTQGPTGNIALLAQNSEAAKVGFLTGSAVVNLVSHVAAVESAASEAGGTPTFQSYAMDTVGSTTVFTPLAVTGIDAHLILQGLRNLSDADGAAPGNRTRWGTNAYFRTPIQQLVAGVVTARIPALEEWVPQDRFWAGAPFALCAQDSLNVLVDGDTVQKRYSPSMFRRTAPTSTTYGATNTLTDGDNGGVSLATGFGTGYNWKDYAVFMHSRAKSHGNPADTTKTILWRFNRFGSEGDVVNIRYSYPASASLPVSVLVEPSVVSDEAHNWVSVRLPSDTARTGVTYRNSTRIGVVITASGTGTRVLTYILGFAVSSAIRNLRIVYAGRNATAFAGLVTGGTSGATGTVVTDTLAGGGTGAGVVILSAVVGTFTPGETITTGGGSTATVNGSPIAYSQLTLDIATPGVTNSGFGAGDQIWVQSSSGSFSSGLKTVLSPPTGFTVPAGDIIYAEGSTTVGATANIGTASGDTGGEATLSGSTVVVNDIASVTTSSSLPTDFDQPIRISAKGNQYWKGIGICFSGAGTVPNWYALNSTAYLSFFPLLSANSKASDIATAVNALAAAANSTCPVTAVAVGAAGVATGVIDKASFDEGNDALSGYALGDGLNWILSHTTPGTPATNFIFTFKNDVNPLLATNSDWINEEVRLVPVTAKNTVDHLNCLAVSGLSSAASVEASVTGGSVQIESLRAGGGGSVQIQGGSAQSLTAPVIGAATVAGTTLSVVCRSADVQGLSGGMWVNVQNLESAPKSVFSATTTLVNLDTDGNFELGVTAAWAYSGGVAARIDGKHWMIEKVGRYTVFTWTGVDAAAPGFNSGVTNGWVIIDDAAATATVSTRNQGRFRVIKGVTNQFWIENPNSLEEIATVGLWFLTFDSIMPGDRLTIGTSIWNVGNRGTWTVESLNNTSTAKFKVNVSAGPTTTVAAGPALGSDLPLVQVLEAVPSRLVKQITGICIEPTGSTLVRVKFSDNLGSTVIGEVNGSTLVALDKLQFPADVVNGLDGYRHSTGLIGEAARILYGDPRDTATYPGVVAAGARVFISGPLVKRIQTALGIRIRSGATEQDIVDAVRSAVAAVINRTGVGASISLSDIVTAAASVNGVLAVTILFPVFGAGSDLISVQPHEKPMILDPEADILISLVGV